MTLDCDDPLLTDIVKAHGINLDAQKVILIRHASKDYPEMHSDTV